MRKLTCGFEELALSLLEFEDKVKGIGDACFFFAKNCLPNFFGKAVFSKLL